MTTINKITSTDCLKALLIIYLFIAFFINISFTKDQHFTLLANSLLSGKLYFTDPLPSGADAAPAYGRLFWPLGPFPAVLIVPGQFVLKTFDLFFYQGYINFFLGILVFILAFRISRKFMYSAEDAFCLSSAFCLASAFVGVWILPWSWFYAQTVAVVLLFMTMYEFIGKKRHWLLGLLIGLTLLTRASAAMFGIVILLELAASKEDLRTKAKKLLLLACPIAIAVVLFFGYNYLRFGDVLEQGYSRQILTGTSFSNRSFGLISLRHLPGNLYYSLINLPTPVFYDGSKVMKFPFLKTDPWGMSIFLTSPYLFCLFWFGYKDKLSKYLLISVIAAAVPVYLYYGIGFMQFGYRYSLDFMPLLFLLLVKNYRERYGELSPSFKKGITISVCLNFYLLATFIFR